MELSYHLLIWMLWQLYYEHLKSLFFSRLHLCELIQSEFLTELLEVWECSLPSLKALLQLDQPLWWISLSLKLQTH